MHAHTLWTAVSGPSDGVRAQRHLLIVSRHHPGLYEYVSQRFAGIENVEVILDRRGGRDRRSRKGDAEVERRAAERRTRPDIDSALRMESMQFLTIPGEPPTARRDGGDPSQGSP